METSKVRLAPPPPRSPVASSFLTSSCRVSSQIFRACPTVPSWQGPGQAGRAVPAGGGRVFPQTLAASGQCLCGPLGEGGGSRAEWQCPRGELSPGLRDPPAPCLQPELLTLSSLPCD